MPHTSSKTVFGALLLLAIFVSSASDRRPTLRGASPLDQSRRHSARNLPAGVERADWQGVLEAHQEWTHTIRRAEGDGQRWEGTNPGTGLRASFGARGGEISPDSGDWQWGLELLSYGIGGEQRSVAGHRPKVGAQGRRIGYDWDGNLEEWYQNGAGGLEHGYTILERPGKQGGAAPLELRVRIRGGLREATIIDDGRGATFGREKGEALIRYRGLKVLDAEGREVAARLEAAEPAQLRLIVEEQTASYPLTIDPTISQQAYLKASNTDADDLFGVSVAISEDTVVVGATGESSNSKVIGENEGNDSAPGSGAAYIFVRENGTTWKQEAYLKARNTDEADNFGVSVAISGNTVVVGAWGEDSNATSVNGSDTDNSASDSGAAYVFVRNSATRTWSQEAYLKALNTGATDNFGLSVAISGGTVAVGALNEDSNATTVNGNSANENLSNSGAAYIFVKESGTTWKQEAYLKASNAGEGDAFGVSVAISGNTVVVGAWYEDSKSTVVNENQSDNSALNAGATYVFVKGGTTWTQEAYLKASNTGGGLLRRFRGNLQQHCGGGSRGGTKQREKQRRRSAERFIDQRGSCLRLYKE